MGRWTPKYSDEERAALIAALVDRNLTIPQTVRAAKLGELDNLPPFDVPKSTCADIRRQERRRRERAYQESADIDSTQGRYARLELDALAIAERQVRPNTVKTRGQLKTPELERMRALWRWLREVRALSGSSTPQAPAPPRAKDPEEPPDAVAEMMADLRREKASTVPRRPKQNAKDQGPKLGRERSNSQSDPNPSTTSRVETGRDSITESAAHPHPPRYRGQDH